MISFLLWVDATPIQWCALSLSKARAIALQFGPPDVLDLSPGDPGLDDRGVNLDQGPRLAPLHRSFVLHPFVERGKGVEPFLLLHDREQAADLEVGLLVGVFELNEPGNRVRFLEALDPWRILRVGPMAGVRRSPPIRS